MKQFSTIRVRLTLWYVLLLGLILVLFSSVLYFTLAQGLYQQMDDGLRLAAAQVAGTANVESGQFSLESHQGENETVSLSERGLLVHVVDLEGRILDSSGPFRSLPVPPVTLAAPQPSQPTLLTLNATGDPTSVRLYSVPYTENGRVYGIIQVGQSLESLQDTLRQLLFSLVLGVPITLVIAILSGLFLADRALSPIDRVTRAAQRMSAENLGQRLDLALPDDEVGRLARTFDAMLARLDEAFRRHRQFTADASHELRTPLTVMKGDIGVALNRPRSIAEYQRVLTELEEEVDRLTRLVGDLLILARTDIDQLPLHLEILDVANLLRSVLELIGPLAAAKGLTLQIQVPDTLSIQGDAERLIQLFLNLLDNAVKYTPVEGQIRLTAMPSLEPAMTGVQADVGRSTVQHSGVKRRAILPRQSDQQRHGHAQSETGIVVQIHNSGPGIPPEHLPHIFERFYRVDESRSRAAGGLGLGLAIARWVVEAHGGAIEAQSALGQGTTFTVRLPPTQA